MINMSIIKKNLRKSIYMYNIIFKNERCKMCPSSIIIIYPKNNNRK